MNKLKHIVVSLAAGLIIGGFLSFKYTSRAVVESDSKTTKVVEKIIVQEKGKTTTVYRTKKEDVKKEVPKPPKQWRMSFLAEPGAPENWQVGVGYRLMGNLFVEGSVAPQRGEVLIGVGIEF